MTRTIPVPVDSPLFAGHFPGRPILPGVAQLALVLEALAGPGEASATARAIPFARFRRIVLPGEELELAVSEGAGGATRVDLRCAGAPVLTAELVVGMPEPPDDWLSTVASRRIAGAPAIDAMLPHRPPMLFVDAVLGEADDGLTCSARIPGGCALVSERSAPAVVALEAAAQTAAVGEGLRRSREVLGGARMGYLVSARDVELYVARIPAEAPLLASVRLTARSGPLAHYLVEVSWETHPVLRGTIGTFLAD